MGELITKVRGNIKKAVGRITGNKRLERSGRLDLAKGEARGVAKNVKRAVKRTVKR